jgi:hypothetical protein
MLVMSYPLTPHKNPDDERLYYTAARAKIFQIPLFVRLRRAAVSGRHKREYIQQ